MKFFYIKMLYVILAWFLGASLAQAGVMSSGGGSTVHKDGWAAPVLLDFYSSGLVGEDYLERPTNTRLPRTSLLDEIPIDMMQPEGDTPIFLQSRLESWRAVNPGLINLIQDMMITHLQMYYTFEKLQRFEDYWLPESLEDGTVVTTIAVFDPTFGPIIHAPSWNVLGVQSQAGLCLHELLRQIWAINPNAFTEGQLQKLTAAIILQNPGETPSLETQEFLSQVTLDGLAAAGQIHDRQRPDFFRRHLHWQHLTQLRAEWPGSVEAQMAPVFSFCPERINNASVLDYCIRRIDRVACPGRFSWSGQDAKYAEGICLTAPDANIYWLAHPRETSRDFEPLYRSVLQISGDTAPWNSQWPTWTAMREAAEQETQSADICRLYTALNQFFDQRIADQ